MTELKIARLVVAAPLVAIRLAERSPQRLFMSVARWRLGSCARASALRLINLFKI